MNIFIFALLGLANCKSFLGDPPPLPAEGKSDCIHARASFGSSRCIAACRDFRNSCSKLLLYAGVRLYQGSKNRSIPNYAMVAGRDFTDFPIDGINSGLWCQSSSAGDNVTVGSWKFPDGNIVHTDDSLGNIHMVNAAGQVGLLRDGEIGAAKGMYICTITDGSNGSHMLVVWAVGTAAYDNGL